MKVSTWAVILFLFFSTAAILLFPNGFSFSQDFFSDLAVRINNGATVPRSVNTLFALSIVTAAIGAVGFFDDKGKWAKTFGWLTGISLAILLLLPSDQFFWPHRWTTVAIVVFLVISCWSMYGKIRTGSRVKTATFIYSVVLSLYVGWLFLGPRPEVSQLANNIHAVTQKIAVYGFILFVLYSNYIKQVDINKK